ncbi:hypothetical protein EEX84_07300 [Planococcus salinus]|uniref:Uncharacterized protein n=1 Tax=Planococcus salinus TaxID=1848460 RepID=A0A3M8P7W1_9BACL|nr:hypothetical protein EEX84_07300 [Planococcus salinus]
MPVWMWIVIKRVLTVRLYRHRYQLKVCRMVHQHLVDYPLIQAMTKGEIMAILKQKLTEREAQKYTALVTSFPYYTV